MSRGLLSVLVCLALATSGCASTGWRKAPSPGVCSVIGMAMGAAGGAVVGNNVSSNHKEAKRAYGALIGLAAGALVGRGLCYLLGKEAKPPTASASASPTSGQAPLTVSLKASADAPDGDIVSYDWDLGDGTKKSGASVEHTYQEPGSYTARLKVTDSNGLTGSANAQIQADAPEAPPAPPAPPVTKKRIVLRGVNFAFDSAELRPDATAILDAAVEVLKENPDARVQVAGHTDSTGPEAYNQQLSERRANAVKDFLEKAGLPASQLTATGFGESQPVASNADSDGRAQNRRVELNTLD